MYIGIYLIPILNNNSWTHALVKYDVLPYFLEFQLRCIKFLLRILKENRRQRFFLYDRWPSHCLRYNSKGHPWVNSAKIWKRFKACVFLKQQNTWVVQSNHLVMFYSFPLSSFDYFWLIVVLITWFLCIILHRLFIRKGNWNLTSFFVFATWKWENIPFLKSLSNNVFPGC